MVTVKPEKGEGDASSNSSAGGGESQVSAGEEGREEQPRAGGLLAPLALANSPSPWQSPGPGRGVCLAQRSVNAEGEGKEKGECVSGDRHAAKRPAGAPTRSARGFLSSLENVTLPLLPVNPAAPTGPSPGRGAQKRPSFPGVVLLRGDSPALGWRKCLSLTFPRRLPPLSSLPEGFSLWVQSVPA